MSAKFDEGLPTETNVTSVIINGVAAVLGTDVDADGNVRFYTTNWVRLGVPITSYLAGPGLPTDPPPSIPLAMSQEYEVTHRQILGDNILPVIHWGQSFIGVHWGQLRTLDKLLHWGHWGQLRTLDKTSMTNAATAVGVMTEIIQSPSIAAYQKQMCASGAVFSDV